MALINIGEGEEGEASSPVMRVNGLTFSTCFHVM